MIKDALKFITELKEAAMAPQVVEVAGKTYCNKDLRRYGEEDMASAIKATTLTSLVDYIKNCGEELREHMVIHVASPTEVILYSGLTKERKRECLFRAQAIVPAFRFDEWYRQERFVIEMQANFEVTPDWETILKVAGNVEAKTTASYGDDGTSQKTTIRQGIATKADVIVPNPVTLVPYRTFLEVEQPASQFVFRIGDIKEEPAFKLVEAEGGFWMNEAKQRIKEYLVAALEGPEVHSKVTVIA